MKDKSKLTAVILVIVTIIVLVLNYFVNNKETEEKKEEIRIVTNYSNFYTVDSCLYRTITYIFKEDKKSLNLILSSSYKKDNNITEENVLDIFDSIEEDSTFESRKMYYEKLNENIVKYYVYGTVLKNQMYDEYETTKQETKDMYFIVYLDNDNKIFAVEPYSKELFEELQVVENEK